MLYFNLKFVGYTPLKRYTNENLSNEILQHNILKIDKSAMLFVVEFL